MGLLEAEKQKAIRFLQDQEAFLTVPSAEPLEHSGRLLLSGKSPQTWWSENANLRVPVGPEVGMGSAGWFWLRKGILRLQSAGGWRGTQGTGRLLSAPEAPAQLRAASPVL